jgi:hypothetical protein
LYVNPRLAEHVLVVGHTTRGQDNLGIGMAGFEAFIMLDLARV